MKKILILLAVSFAAVLPACQNNDDLWDAVNDLKSRVQALETQVAALNKNIEALQELAKEGQTITNVELKDGIYTITLSDGEKLTLTQGSNAIATIPLMGIDKDGFWVVDYQDGKGFQQILVDGKPVKAAGTDAPAPKFKLEDTTGYWMVSTDNGTTYNYVLNDKGEKVSAFGTGSATDSFFKTVEVKDGFLHIEMLTGEKLSIPVVSDFYCRIITTEEGVQVFSAGESQSFKVEIKGVESTKLTAPEGWRAQLAENGESEALLTITAPASSVKSSRSIEADTRTDVAIEAFSNKYSSMSKIQVRLSDVVIPKVTTVTEKANSATSSTLTFTVTVSPEGSDWYWMSLSETAPAPTPAAIVAANNKGVGTEFTATTLSLKTTYKVYAVAVASDGTVDKNVASASATTTDTDYYEDGVTIDGVTYNKNSEGAQLLSATDADVTISDNSGIFFLDAKNGHKFTISTALVPANLVFIGRNPSTKPIIEITGSVNWKLGATATGENSGLIFKNVDVDVKLTNYMFNFNAASGICKLFAIEDSRFSLPSGKSLSYFSSGPGAGIEKILIRNSVLHVSTSTENTALFNLHGQKAGLSLFKDFILENNVIYAPTSMRGYILSISNYNATEGQLDNLSVVCKNNSFVNFIGRNTPYFVFGKIKSLTIEKNIFYSDGSGTADYYNLSYMFRCGFDYNTNPPAPLFSLDDNKVYGLTNGWSKSTSINSTNSIYSPYSGATNIYTKETESPLTVDFTNETFKSRIPGYGATIK